MSGSYLLYRDGIEEKVDGPPKVSVTRDGHTVESYLVKGRKKFFVTLSGSHFCAHGHTLADAVADAIWKDPKRRPSLEELKQEIQKAGKKRKITLNEFRVLTGACKEGCRIALKRAGLDESPMTPHDVAKNFPDWGGKLLRVLEWDQK